MPEPLSMSVLVPSYNRLSHLTRCIVGLQQQSRPADEIIIVVRESDEPTLAALEKLSVPKLRIATVTKPGLVTALNTGLAAAHGDVIAFTDDDAVPHHDWLERIEKAFGADSSLAGVGGRDVVFENRIEIVASKQVVGKLLWYGKTIGNHHIGQGPARYVDNLKGVNMSFRRSAIGGLQFDSRVRGNIHTELGFCFKLRGKGWKLLYDPRIQVDHYPAPRPDGPPRGQFDAHCYAQEVHNEYLALLEYLSPTYRLVFSVWAVLIGARGCYGVVQLLKFLPTERTVAVKKFWAALCGEVSGWFSFLFAPSPRDSRLQ